jgi:hypothetical protein
MKTSFLILVCTLAFLQGRTQPGLEKMDLKNIVKNEDSIKLFIEKDFENIIFNRKTLIESGHSLAFEEFNKKIKIPTQVSVYGIPADDVYAYKANDSNFALYLLIEIDMDKIKLITDHLGLPENIEEFSEIESGQFSFLNWNFESLSFWLDKDVFANSKYKTANKCILTITNMPISEVRNKEELF